jgi:O-antigen ligase
MTAPLELAYSATFVAAGVLVALFCPAWTPAALVVLAPWRAPASAAAAVEPPTLFLLAAASVRAPAISTHVGRSPLIAATTLALPLWILTSALWAKTPYFAVAEAGKWCVPALAALLVATPPQQSPQGIVVAMLAATIPFAAWGVLERLSVITPLGDPELLRRKLILLGDLVRGRALFSHPNKLAELLDQTGLFLAACAVLGPLRWPAAAGLAVALGGSWASGSLAGLATLVGGTCLTIAWLVVRPPLDAARAGQASPARPGRRLGRFVAALTVLAAAVAAGLVAWLAYRRHHGLASRAVVYEFALGLIRQHPLLGLGGGNYIFAVVAAPPGLSRFWFGPHCHSLLLQLCVELGLVGAVLGFAFFAAPIARGLATLGGLASDWRGVRVGAIVGVAGLLAHNLVNYFLNQPANGVITGVLLGLMAIEPDEPSSNGA